MKTDDAIKLIGKWIVDSIPATSVDRLVDHVTQAKLDTNDTYDIGEQLIDAINDEGGGE